MINLPAHLAWGSSVKDIPAVIDNIYEASVTPEVWDGVLDSLGSMINSEGASMMVYHADGWGSWRASEPLRPVIAAFLESDVPPRTGTTARLRQMQHPGFVSELEAFSVQERAEEPLFKDVFRVLGIGDSAATGLFMANGDMLLFLVMRSAVRGDFAPGEAAKLDVPRPHLARSAMLASRLRMQRFRAAAEALAVVGLPAAILSPLGHVLAANHLLQELQDFVTWLPQDRMALCDRDANALLSRLIREMRGNSASMSRSFPVRNTDGSEIFVGHVIPTPGRARDFFDGASAVFVLTSTAIPQGADLLLIQTLFDLTPAEARVAHAVVEGATIEDMAKRWSVSRETIRSQIKSVLAKTGVRRQAELVGRLGALSKLPMRL